MMLSARPNKAFSDPLGRRNACTAFAVGRKGAMANALSMNLDERSAPDEGLADGAHPSECD